MTATAYRPRARYARRLGRLTVRPLRTEYDHQVAVATWARGVSALQPDSPLRWLHATQNGLRTSVIQAAMAKRSGLVAGPPDLILDVACRGFHGARIELKAPPTYDAQGRVDKPGGKLSDEQDAWLRHLAAERYFAAVAWGADAAIAALRWYLGEPIDAVCREYAITTTDEGDDLHTFSRWRPVKPPTTSRRRTPRPGATTEGERNAHHE